MDNPPDSPTGAGFLKEVYGIWIAERPTQLAAALAYFGLFSFAPIIYIAFQVAGFFFDKAALMDRFLGRLEAAFGPGVTQAVTDLLENLSQTAGGSFLISLISFVALLLAASGVFFQLQFSLNTVWRIPPARITMLQMMRKRLFSFLMVIGVCLLLVVSAAIGLLISWLSSISILEGFQFSLTVAGFIVLATLSFGVMYKLLPEVKIAWQDVWLGAIVAATLVTIGGLLIAFFMKNTRLSSALEAAGAFVVLLTGFFYFAQIFLFGAVLTRVYAQRYGSMRRLTGENHP